MAISAISERHYGFTFDGESSKDYGFYITDGGFYSAPARDVEVVEIPGRNGAFIRDKGRFKNIQVTYKAVMGATSESDFIDGISEVRNWLCSKTGYVRLEDDFNPGEYRLVVCSEGIGVSNLNIRTGEFDITFDCMPQRFLTSGESAQTIAESGDTLTNPTRFSSRPMLEVTGYGKVGINGDDIQIVSEPIGRTQILPYYSEQNPGSSSVSFEVSPDYRSLRSGDRARIDGGHATARLGGKIVNISGFTESGGLVHHTPTGYNSYTLIFPFSASYSYYYGTAQAASAYVEVTVDADGAATLYRVTLNLSIDAEGTITVTMSGLSSPERCSLEILGIIAMSTKTALGEPLYLDLDIGEAYKIEDDLPISVNSAVILGTEMPLLKPGTNTITFDNTVMDLKIVPRWWKV